MGHCCGTLLWDSLPAPLILRVLKLYYKVASSQLPAPQILHVLKLYYKVASSQLPAPPDKSHSRLHFAHSTRTISAEGCARVGQNALSPAFRALDTHDLRRGLRAHGKNRTLACISRTRRARCPQRVARAWDKSHSRLHLVHSTRTISAEGCASSLQNERFVRDFLKNSHVKVCKTSVSYKTSSKGQAKTPIGAHTSRSPAKQFRDSSPSKQHRNGTGTFTSTTTHNLTIPCACHESFPIHTSNAHNVLRLPRNVTSLTPRNLTIPCACHENCTSTLQSPHEVLRLPRKVTISLHVSFNKICTTPHVWNDFDPFRAHSHAETCHENRALMPHPETQIPMARPHPTPQKDDSPNANPNGTAQQTADLTKRCACAVKCITFLARHVGIMQITME